MGFPAFILSPFQSILNIEIAAILLKPESVYHFSAQIFQKALHFRVKAQILTMAYNTLQSLGPHYPLSSIFYLPPAYATPYILISLFLKYKRNKPVLGSFLP